MAATLTADPEYARDVLAQLVAIPSVNPDLGESSGEAAAAAYVAHELRSAGLDVSVLEHGPGRASIVGTLRGTAPGPTLMLNGHIDTVPAGAMAHAFEPRVRGGRLFGRGSYDMKGGVAACLAAVRAVASSGVAFPGALLVSAVADEEAESLGTRAVLDRGAPDAVVVAEPTALVPCSAHRGFVWIEVQTHGRTAHGSMPAVGRDANRMMGRVLAEIDRIAGTLSETAAHRVTGPGSLHVGRLNGGGVWSAYADRCVLGLERRTVPGETGVALVKELETRLASISTEHPDFRADIDLVLERPPFQGDPSSTLVSAIQGTRMTRGSPAAAVPFWTDAALFAAAGADAIVLGPDGGGAHTDEEWVELDTVSTLATLMARASLDYLSTASRVDIPAAPQTT